MNWKGEGIHRNLSRDRPIPDQDFNRACPAYEAYVLTIGPGPTIIFESACPNCQQLSWAYGNYQQ
jgi:hypothetical protein